MSELVVVDPLPLKSALAWLCIFWFAFVFWSCRVGECRTSLPSRAISPCRGFVELALEIPEIAGNLKMDELSRAEILKYFYLRAGGSFRELQELLKNAAKANASDEQGIKAQINEWYRKKIGPIKDVLAETEEEELQQFVRRLLGQKPESKYLDYVTKVAEAGPNGYLSGAMTRTRSCRWSSGACSRSKQSCGAPPAPRWLCAIGTSSSTSWARPRRACKMRATCSLSADVFRFERTASA